ncbi:MULTISPECIES: hypothetical protein [Acinetobacter]|uniref:Uncharacterized protein n=1 Tax=Acinetobacter courvalinii TaxID=280147 RepID=A0AA42I4J0_9GAMM|nr:hypothetical protein [Acinetobacter courvalinii]MCU4367484.1 hypothetical protein [Acinetobacter courvalinii]MCU4445690.1 hypothetical protein [Acinetobacter courvalinii]MDH0562339.1 hypothetical protein [Acinetobacter courvalinii]
MLLFIIVLVVIGLVLFILWVKKTSARQVSSDSSDSYSPTPYINDSSQHHASRHTDHCSISDSTSSDSGSCDGGGSSD